MKKRFGVVILFLCLLCIFSLAACDGFLDKVNSEFAEYAKIVTDIAANSVAKMATVSHQTVAAKNDKSAHFKKMSAVEVAGQRIFDLLDAQAQETNFESLKSFYDDVFQQSFFIPVICGDVLIEKYNAKKFYDIPISFWGDPNQYILTENTGTIKRSYIYTPSYGQEKDTFIIMEVEYKSETDFSFRAIEFTADYSYLFYAYGNSSMEFIGLSRNTNERAESYQGLCLIDGTPKSTDDVDTINACLVEIESNARSVDPNAFKEKFKSIDYEITKEEFLSSSAKYFEVLGKEESSRVGFIVEDGTVMTYVSGNEDSPTELTLPKEANAVFAVLELPVTTKKLIIPSNITSVKNYKSTQDGEEAEQKETLLEECPVSDFVIRVRGVDAETSFLKEIEVEPDSAIFKTENHCLYSKDGNLLYIPENDQITELTLEGAKMKTWEHGGYRNIHLPNLKNVVCNVSYVNEDGREIVLDPFSFLFSEGERSQPFYNLDSVVINDTPNYMGLYGNISVKKLFLNGTRTDDLHVDFLSPCTIDQIEFGEQTKKVFLNVESNNVKIGEVVISDQFERLIGYTREGNENIGVRFPWSQFTFEVLRKYSILGIDDSSYDELMWDYESTEHDFRSFTCIFQPLSEEEKAAKRDFIDIQFNSAESGLFETGSIAIFGYRGADRAVHVPETLAGYPVKDFCLSNYDYRNLGILPSINNVKELYLPKTLEQFTVYNDDVWGGEDKYILDKIEYNGTTQQFVKLMDGEVNAYSLLTTLTSKIKCLDQNLGEEAPPTKERYDYAGDGWKLRLYFDWDYDDLDPLHENGYACYAEFEVGGKTYLAHQMMYTEFSFNFEEIVFINESGKEDCDYKYFFQIRTTSASYSKGEVHEVHLSCRYKPDHTSEATEINIEFVQKSSSDKVIEHVYDDTPTYIRMPDCLSEGWATYRCTLCWEETSRFYCEPLGHNFVNECLVEATCVRLQHKTHECSRCNASEEFDFTGEFAEHKFTIKNVLYEPTCVKYGAYNFACEVCGNYSNDTIIPATNIHTYDDEGLCSQCRAEHEFYRLQMYDDGFQVYGVKDDTAENLDIPAYFGDKPTRAIRLSGSFRRISIPSTVREIDIQARLVTLSLSVAEDNPYFLARDGILYDKNTLEMLIVPCNLEGEIEIADGVTVINAELFSRTYITKLSIPNSVVEILKIDSMDYCDKLAEISVSQDSENFSGLGGILYNKGLHEILYVPKAVKGDVIIPDSVSRLNSRFYGRKEIISIIVPDSVTDISKFEFSGCDKLISITLPFVGQKKDSSENTFFGVVFGAYNNIPSSLKTVIITGGSFIDDKAFYACNSLTSLIIPDSVKRIGNNAFEGCYSLTNFIIPANVESLGSQAFFGCENLSSIIVPDSVTTIGSGAFENCRSLTEITLPFIGAAKDGTDNMYFQYIFNGKVPISLATVNVTGGTSIGEMAFSCCFDIKSVTIVNSVTSIGNRAFEKCSSLTNVVIPDSVESLGEYVFSDCSSLTSIEIPNKVTSIGSNAFAGCSKLTKISIPESVISIGSNAFYGCSSLTSIVIPDGVTSIDGGSFYGCSSLTSIVIPNKVTSIGNAAFHGCSSLTSIVIPDSVTLIDGGAFSDCSKLKSLEIGQHVKSISFQAFANCSVLTSVVIPNSVTSIGSDAFAGCSELASLTIGSSVTSIGNRAFKKCSSLINVVIPDSVESLGENVFSDCSNLTSIEIPNKVTSIGSNAFSGCGNLTKISIPESVTSIGAGAFDTGASSVEINYNGTKEQWQALTYQHPVKGTINCTNGTIVE